MNKNITDRLTYLAEFFDVFDTDVEGKIEALTLDGYDSTPIVNKIGDVIAISSYMINKKDRIHKKISVSSDVFTNMLIADPTDNKIYLQWMLNLFTRLLKEGKIISLESAIRFVDEDLPQAKEYLVIFEENKRKQKFKNLCFSSYILKGITDPTNINQYKSLTQLFDAVDPFIEKEPTEVEKLLMRFVNNNQAIIPVKDRKYTLYIPKTRDASVVFEKFTNWCTSKSNNGMFENYRGNYPKPNGYKSDIYIIINNKFFSGESDELYQIHFESNQLRDRKNGQNVSIFETVLMESEGLSNFFHEELVNMAKLSSKNIRENRYLDFLIQFGFAESMFELFDENSQSITCMDKDVPKLPDMSRFKMVDQLSITDGKLLELPSTIGELINLEMLVLTNNKLKSLPKEIGNLKNLIFINIKGNKISDLPEELKYLDSSNGGSLERIAFDKEEIGEENYNKLKRLLPTTVLG